jgi:hypothetical protein
LQADKGEAVYQQIMYDVNRMWLEEWDREQARRLHSPRRSRPARGRWRGLFNFRRTPPVAARPAARARIVAQAPQCR